jgi:hypothetical protein
LAYQLRAAAVGGWLITASKTAVQEAAGLALVHKTLVERAFQVKALQVAMAPQRLAAAAAAQVLPGKMELQTRRREPEARDEPTQLRAFPLPTLVAVAQVVEPVVLSQVAQVAQVAAARVATITATGAVMLAQTVLVAAVAAARVQQVPMLAVTAATAS